MSTHKVTVVEVHSRPHPNADRLRLVSVSGWQVVVGKGDFYEGELAAYVPPDYVVPIDIVPKAMADILAKQCKIVDGRNQAEDGYVKGFRVSTKKFRGEWSQGLLLKLKPDDLLYGGNVDKHGKAELQAGDDVMAYLGIGHWEPPVESSFEGETEMVPMLPAVQSAMETYQAPVPKFDVEPYRNEPELIPEGTMVQITEKIDGMQARYMWDGNRFWAGSKSLWRKASPNSPWWQMLERTPHLKDFLRDHKHLVVYGEIYGSGVQDETYGLKNGDKCLKLFDMFEGGKYMSPTFAMSLADENCIPWVPVLATTQFHPEEHLKMADGLSSLGNGSIREGIVIRPLDGRVDGHGNRVVLKVVSDVYLSKQ
jgi:RNA ligase (TIGR02306 family)